MNALLVNRLRAQGDVGEVIEIEKGGYNTNDPIDPNDPSDPSDFPDKPDEDPSDSDDDYDDFDEGDDPFSTMYKDKIEVRVSCTFNDRKNASFFVRPSWKVKSLCYLIANKWDIYPSLQGFRNIQGDVIYKNFSFTQNSVKDGATLRMVLDLGGGGKRGASGSVKQSKSKNQKVEDLFDSIDTIILKAEKDSSSDLSKQTASMFKHVVNCLKSSPPDVLNASLGDFSVEHFQRFSVALTSRNVDFKSTAFGKEVFHTIFDRIESHRRECDNLQKGMSDVGYLVLLLSQYGNEDGSISWTPLADRVGKCLTEKSKPKASVSSNPTG